MSDFAVPMTNPIAAQERCPNCGSGTSQAILDLSKCLDCGSTWVSGSSQPLVRQPTAAELRVLALEDALNHALNALAANAAPDLKAAAVREGEAALGYRPMQRAVEASPSQPDTPGVPALVTETFRGSADAPGA